MTDAYLEPDSAGVDRSEAFEEAREAAPEHTGPGWQRACARLTNNPRFGSLVIGVIVANALLLGLGTYPGVQHDYSGLISTGDNVFLGFFCVELTLRLAAVGFRVDRFFSRGWNVFDFVAVGASFVPGLGTNATALRLIRLLRVARLLSVLPDVKVLVDGLRRAARPATGILLLTFLLSYLYGIVGWSLFGTVDEERWGTIGRCLLTLFQLLTHHHWPNVLAPIRDHSPWAIPFVVSFLVIGGLMVLQMLLAVVLTSLKQAHRAARGDTAATGHGAGGLMTPQLAQSIEAMRATLSALERRQQAARNGSVSSAR